MTKILPISIYIIIELIYIISCIKVIIKIRPFVNSNIQLRPFCLSLLIMLTSGIICTIIKPFFLNSPIERIFFTSFFIFEIISLYLIQEYALRTKVLKFCLTLSLFTCLIYIIKLGLLDYNFNAYNIFFVFESIIAGTIAMVYFLQLNYSISLKNLNEDPLTFIMLGFFFCFSLPLSYTSSFISIEYMNPNSLKILNRQDAIIFLLISRIGTVCYIVFNLFILKAMKCKLILHTGHQ